MTAYVRLTFNQLGKPRTVWAEVVGRKPGQLSGTLAFWRVKRDGERPDPQELIILTVGEAKTQPARMSLKYASLFLSDDPDLNNEVDNVARQKE